MSLLDFDACNDLSVFTDLFIPELKYLCDKALPKEVLFIPYGYEGDYYSSYIQEVIKVFKSFNVGVKIITDGDPAALIKAAQCIVVGGGSLEKILEGVAGYKSYLCTALMNGKPYLGWNEGAVLPSPSYLVPALLPTYQKGLAVTSLQIYAHYIDSDLTRFDIKNFLLNHKNDTPPIRKVFCLSDRPGGSGIRLEDDVIGVNFAGGTVENPGLQFILDSAGRLISS
jgi:hypothetical protein